MKYKSALFLTVIATIVTLGAFYPKVNFEERESLILYAVINSLDQAHFRPKKIDNTFSQEVFINYLKYIDNGKRFFIQSEIDQLKVYELDLDEQAKNKSLVFFDLSVDLLKTAINRAEKTFNDLIETDFNIEKQETFELDNDKRSWSKNETELEDYWRKAIKYELINRLDRKLDDQKKALENKKKESTEADIKESIEDIQLEDGADALINASFDELKAQALKGTKKMYSDWFERLKKLRRSDRFETYINAITHIYDPHSDYYNPKEKQDFDINMGGKLEGIGAKLQTDGDYTKVVSIIAGGPAWKGKELEVGDLIHKVTQKGKEAVDITGMRIDDVVTKIRGKKGTTVVLSVKKSNGEMVDIAIERDIVNIQETFAKSAILSIPQVANNIGYIKLPKFYSSFEKKDGNSCSQDVAEEIEKLKKQNVNGIILDLRFNGGGSLNDVVRMSGLFIEDGPIVQVKPRYKKAYVYNDEDPKVKYDGPLIVMVNNFSASASEILAAALQDYERAIIVGSTSTFGKGTVQRFFDLDNAIRGNTEFKPLGEVKLTMQKFFRINGGSTQLKGVTPDIILPDSYSFLEFGEKEYDQPMEWTKIEPAFGGYSQDVFKLKNLDQIKQNSLERVSRNSEFELILENAKRLKENKDKTSYPLNFTAFSDLIDKREMEAKKYKNLMSEPINNFYVANLSADEEKINFDDVSVDKNKEWIENLQKDIYLEEVMHILAEMI